ncbi:MAG: hypothetical protein ABSF87_20345 [Xanthobacteraceae bacterium]|jgi:hypothetical protein
MQRKLIQASVILALLTGPAFAQNSSLSVPVNPQKPPPTQEEIEKQKAADRAYNAAMQKIPDKKSSVDPWGNIRPSSPSASKNKQQ